MPAVIATFDAAETTVRRAARPQADRPEAAPQPTHRPTLQAVPQLVRPAGVQAAPLPRLAAQPATPSRGVRLIAAVAAVGVTLALLAAVLGIAAHERADARQQVQAQAAAPATATVIAPVSR